MTLSTIENVTWAKALLDGRRDHFRDGGLLLIGQAFGTGLTDYLRVHAVHTNANGDQCADNMTWAIGTALGYKLRDLNGQWVLALGGGGYSKPLDVAIALRGYYGLENLRYETI